MSLSVGFIGLGNMGRPMAHNLLDAGFPLTLFNRTAARADALRQAGAGWADTPRAVAEQSDVVLSILADDAAVRAVALGENGQGVLSGLEPGGVHVDMSTVSPDVSREVASRYRERGVDFVAAPVFGRPEAAAAAKLWVCPAGPPAAIDRCRPLFEALGQGVIVVGEDPHSANVLKLVGNFFVISAIETLSEALTLAEKGGLQSATVMELIGALLPVPLFQGYGGRIARQEFSPAGFALALGLKDVGLMQQLAKDVAAPLPLADVADTHLRAAFARGRGDLDWGALATVVREMAGLDPGTGEPSDRTREPAR